MKKKNSNTDIGALLVGNLSLLLSGFLFFNPDTIDFGSVLGMIMCIIGLNALFTYYANQVKNK